MQRYLFASKSTDPFYNLALENWFLKAERFAGSELMFIYRNEPCVVIGRNQNVWAECNVPLAKARRVPILRRFSGGGAVIHDLGNWNYSFHVDRAQFTRSAGAELIMSAVDPKRLHLSLSPRHDIYCGEAKVSGSAFKITRTRAYHHGTLLLESRLHDLLPLLHTETRILPPDEECPFGGISSVRAAKVDNFTGCSAVEFPGLIEKAFGVMLQVASIPEAELESDQRLLRSWDWTFAKSPVFKARLQSGHIVRVAEGLVDGQRFDDLI